MFYFDEIEGQRVLKSNYLENVTAFFTTRGFDTSTLNEFDTSIKRVITPVQTHSDHIEIVDERSEYPDTDGLIVTRADTLVYLRFADCTPLILYDEINKIGAISHAGWRGTAAKIGIKTLEKMGVNFGTKPQNVVTIIGPAIGCCCYEVSDDVKNKLLSTVENPLGLSNGKKVDLKQINSRQFEEAGVSKIDICPYCTSCNNDLFYSYRKEGGTTARHYAVFKLS